MQRAAITLLLVWAVLVPGCTVKLTVFQVPPYFHPGGLFEVVVAGTHSGTNANEQAAAVLQIPQGFTVVAASNIDGVAITWNDPAVLALYQAEPGYYLAAFSGKLSGSSSGKSPHVLRVRLRAPALTAGTFTFKVSLAAQSGSTWKIDDPPGVGNFAKITTAPYVQTARMEPHPWTGQVLFENAAEGLPARNPPTAQDSGWSGVAFGDVDGDGWEDLACIARKGLGPQVYLFRGAARPWQSASQGLRYSFSGRSDVAFGDFNGDGKLDLADGNGRAWLGDGRGGWRAATGIRVRAGTEGVAVADVNGDGFDDVAFGGHFADLVQVFLSDGKGGFRESSQGLPKATTGRGGHKLLLKDLDGDGDVDLLWTWAYKTAVWLGDGKGNWQLAANHGLNPHQHWGVDAGDLDGDGDQDLVLAVFGAKPPQTTQTVEVYENLGGARWKLRTNTGLPSVPDSFQDVALADLDGDDRLDIVVGRRSTTGQKIHASIEVYQNRGNFQFRKLQLPDLPAGYLGIPEGVAVGDVNGDAFPDIGVAAYEMYVSVWLNRWTGFHRFGRGCGKASVPRIGVNSLPRVGNTGFAWTLTQAPPNQPALFIMGLSKRHFFGLPILPLDLGPFGAPGCKLLVEPRVQLAVRTDGSGRAVLPLPIPNHPALVGALFFAQWGIVEPGANPLNLAVSDGGAVRIAP